MKAEKILQIIKEVRLSQLRRNLSFYQAFVISILVALFLTIFDSIKQVINGSNILGDIITFTLLLPLLYFFGRRFSNTSLLVEFKEERVHKWKRKKALEHINEEKEEI